jgi:hypothetical protein
VIYLIGSLRNNCVPLLANRLREVGHEVFDDWYSAGHEADDMWKSYEDTRGRSYKDALAGHAAQHVFQFDLKHLQRCDTAVLVMPAGKSCHLELGYALGQGKRGYVLFDAVPDRYDVMYNFANGVFFDIEELVKELECKPVAAAKSDQQATTDYPFWGNLIPTSNQHHVRICAHHRVTLNCPICEPLAIHKKGNPILNDGNRLDPGGNL